MDTTGKPWGVAMASESNEQLSSHSRRWSRHASMRDHFWVRLLSNNSVMKNVQFEAGIHHIACVNQAGHSELLVCQQRLDCILHGLHITDYSSYDRRWSLHSSQLIKSKNCKKDTIHDLS